MLPGLHLTHVEHMVSPMSMLFLKMPVDKAQAVVNAIERDLDINRTGQEAADLRLTLDWLRYRITRHTSGITDSRAL